MNFPRRTFLRTGALAMLGGVFAPVSVKAASARKLALSAEEQAVADWLGGFSDRVQLVGGAVYEKLQGRATRQAHWRAEVADFARMADGLSRAAGVTGVYSAGETVFFLSGECEMAVENVMAATFGQREAARSGGSAAFAHETLAYDPASGEVSDPIGAAGSSELRLIQRGRSLAEAFDTVLRGLIESNRLGLDRSAAFRRFQARVLAAKVSRPAVARPISRALLGRLATFSEAAAADEVASVIASPLVTSSLRVALGTDAQRTIRRAQTADGSPAAWVAALMGRDPARAWLASGDYFDRLRSQAALAEARTLAG